MAVWMHSFSSYLCTSCVGKQVEIAIAFCQPKCKAHCRKTIHWSDLICLTAYEIRYEYWNKSCRELEGSWRFCRDPQLVCHEKLLEACHWWSSGEYSKHRRTTYMSIIEQSQSHDKIDKQAASFPQGFWAKTMSHCHVSVALSWPWHCLGFSTWFHFHNFQAFKRTFHVQSVLVQLDGWKVRVYKIRNSRSLARRLLRRNKRKNNAFRIIQSSKSCKLPCINNNKWKRMDWLEHTDSIWFEHHRFIAKLHRDILQMQALCTEALDIHLMASSTRSRRFWSFVSSHSKEPSKTNWKLRSSRENLRNLSALAGLESAANDADIPDHIWSYLHNSRYACATTLLVWHPFAWYDVWVAFMRYMRRSHLPRYTPQVGKIAITQQVAAIVIGLSRLSIVFGSQRFEAGFSRNTSSCDFAAGCLANVSEVQMRILDLTPLSWLIHTISI